MNGAKQPLASVFFRAAAVKLPSGRQGGREGGREEGEGELFSSALIVEKWRETMNRAKQPLTSAFFRTAAVELHI